MQVFNTEKEFHQAAFNYVAMCISEAGAEYLSGGNEADICEEFLDYLAQTCTDKGLSAAQIKIYLHIIAEENEHIRMLDKW